MISVGKLAVSLAYCQRKQVLRSYQASQNSNTVDAFESFWSESRPCHVHVLTPSRDELISGVHPVAMSAASQLQHLQSCPPHVNHKQS